MNDLKRDVQNTRFVEAVEEFQDAINIPHRQRKNKKTMQKSSMAFVHLFEGFFRTIPQTTVCHPMISISCMTLMTMGNTRALRTFMHTRNALPMLSSVRRKLLGILLPLCLPHQVPQLTKVTHHKKQSHKPSLIMSIWMDARTRFADWWHPCCSCTPVEEPGNVGGHMKC